MRFKFKSELRKINDQDVINRLIHPLVFAKLGVYDPVINGDTLSGKTKNNKDLKAKGKIRFKSNIQSKKFLLPDGYLVIKRDGLEIVANAFVYRWSSKGKRRKIEIARLAIRDRQLDGTEVKSPLCQFPNTHLATNRAPHPDFLTAELSVYCFDPDSIIDDKELAEFTMNLDDYLFEHFDPRKFFQLWTRAYESEMARWQNAAPIKGVAKHFVDGACSLLKDAGYHRVDAVPSWYNVGLFFIEKFGFSFTYGEHEAAYNALQLALKRLEHSFGLTLNTRQKSWIVALQSVPEAYIPEELKLGVKWINSPTDTSYVARVHKDLNQFNWHHTAQVIPESLKVSDSQNHKCA